MKRFLIVYATREGQAGKIAWRIAEHLRNLGCDVTVHNAAESFESGTQFDYVLYGGSMHAGGIEHELLTFMKREHEALAVSESGFFLVLLSAATRDPTLRKSSMDDSTEKVREQLPLEFDHIEMIAGALKYSKYRWPMKWIMRRIAKQAGGDTDMSKDYEYTDWDAVRKFAERLAAE